MNRRPQAPQADEPDQRQGSGLTLPEFLQARLPLPISQEASRFRIGEILNFG